MTLTKYGWKRWLPILFAGSAIALFFIWLIQFHSLWWIALFFTVFLTVAFLSFFRNPWRLVPKNLPEGTMLSPADGVISAIEYSETHEGIDGPAVIIRIFLSVFNVHINRVPCDCVVQETIYRPGKFLDARSAESAKINESNLIILQVGSNRIALKQISGKIARRIVCSMRINDTLTQGQQFGMITFGSTTELILPKPDKVRLHVEEGNSVKGGVTRLATLATDA